MCKADTPGVPGTSKPQTQFNHTMAPAMPASVTAHIVSYLELMPGVLATPATLEAMLKHIKDDRFVMTGGGTSTAPEHGVIMAIKNYNTPKICLSVEVRGPYIEEGEDNIWASDYLTSEEYPVTHDGLMRAIVESKQTIADHRKRGICPTCATRTHPRRRLKGPGMPRCCGCSLGDMMGI